MGRGRAPGRETRLSAVPVPSVLPHSPSPWAPLRRPLFRNLWLATVLSNVGTWMHEVGAGWLMVTLDPSPLMVSLVQASTVLPIFFLSLPAGTLADMFDRRAYLIAMQVWMLLAAALLATITLLGVVGPWSLLALTFTLAAGAAMMTPAWAASVPGAGYEAALDEGEDDDEPEANVATLPLGNIVRYAHDRVHPESLSHEAADVLRKVIQGETAEMVDRALADLFKDL